MNLLLDENLSPKIATRLTSLFPGIVHVRDRNLNRSPDIAIWNWAKDNEFTVLTTDSDFLGLSARLGFPPKVIHLKQCDYPLRVIVARLQTNALRISEFCKNPF